MKLLLRWCMACFALTGLAVAQSPRQILLPSAYPAQMTVHPAMLASMAEGVIRVGVDGQFQFANTAVPFSWFDQADGFLDTDDKNTLIDGIQGRERLFSELGGQVQVQYGHSTGTAFSVGYAQWQTIAGSLADADLARVALNGNASYQGQTLAGENAYFSQTRHQELQLGMAKALGLKVHLGAQLALINGQSGRFAELTSFSLYTGPLGDSVRLAANYLDRIGEQAWGGHLALSGTWLISDRLNLEAGVHQLGFLRWQGTERTADASYGTSGLDGGPLFDNLFPFSDSLFRLDSLTQLFLPDPVDASWTRNFLPQAFVGVRWKSDNFKALALLQGQSWPDGQWVPTVSLSALYQVNKPKDSYYELGSIGLSMSSSPWQPLGLGIMAKGVIPVVANQYVHLFVFADDLQGWVLSSGRAASVRAGLMYVIL